MRTHVWPKFARAGIRVLRVALPLWSAVALVPLLLAFTSVPGKMHRWLAATPCQLQEAPEFVVLLGGEGIPSASGLLRTYCAAEQAREHAAARIVVALPSDPADEDSDIVRTKRELVLRGVSPDRIWFEPKGRSARFVGVDLACGRVFPARDCDRGRRRRVFGLGGDPAVGRRPADAGFMVTFNPLGRPPVRPGSQVDIMAARIEIKECVWG